VEAILLDLSQVAHINLNSKVFNNMPNLRLLDFMDHDGVKSVSLPRGLDSLPMHLRYLRWDGYPLKSLPRTFRPAMLVELSLQDSNVEKLWKGTLVCIHFYLSVRPSVHSFMHPSINLLKMSELINLLYILIVPGFSRFRDS